jgi:hypothetical protein
MIVPQGCQSWFQKTNLIRPLRSVLIAGQKLIRNRCPGDREQRQNRNNGQCFHGLSSFPIVAKSVRAWRIFWANE